MAPAGGDRDTGGRDAGLAGAGAPARPNGQRTQRYRRVNAYERARSRAIGSDPGLLGLRPATRTTAVAALAAALLLYMCRPERRVSRSRWHYSARTLARCAESFDTAAPLVELANIITTAATRIQRNIDAMVAILDRRAISAGRPADLLYTADVLAGSAGSEAGLGAASPVSSR